MSTAAQTRRRKSPKNVFEAFGAVGNLILMTVAGWIIGFRVFVVLIWFRPVSRGCIKDFLSFSMAVKPEETEKKG